MTSDRVSVALLRSCYRTANLGLSLDRRIRPSRGRGVKFIVDGGDRGILLVRHTYGSRQWTLPGGRVQRGELPAAAAERELREELSLTAPGLIDLGSYPGRVHRRREQVSVFLTECQDRLPVANPVELAEIRWFSRGEIPNDSDANLHSSLGLLAGHLAERAARPGHSAR